MRSGRSLLFNNNARVRIQHILSNKLRMMPVRFKRIFDCSTLKGRGIDNEKTEFWTRRASLKITRDSRHRGLDGRRRRAELAGDCIRAASPASLQWGIAVMRNRLKRKSNWTRRRRPHSHLGM